MGNGRKTDLCVCVWLELVQALVMVLVKAGVVGAIEVYLIFHVRNSLKIAPVLEHLGIHFFRSWKAGKNAENNCFLAD
jgi:hypothetical protein